MARVPGSILARTLLNRYREYAARNARPGPGRLEPLQQWYLRHEGALLAGVFVGTLGVVGVKVYTQERLDDLSRRTDRRDFHGAACEATRARVRNLQASCAFWRALGEEAAEHARRQWAWHASCAAARQRAAARADAWQARLRAVCSAPAARRWLQHATGLAPPIILSDEPSPLHEAGSGAGPVASVSPAACASTAPGPSGQQPAPQHRQGSAVAAAAPPSPSWGPCGLVGARLAAAMREAVDAERRAEEATDSLFHWLGVQQLAEAKVAELTELGQQELLVLAAHAAQLQAWEQVAPAHVVLHAALPLPQKALSPLQALLLWPAAPTAAHTAGSGSGDAVEAAAPLQPLRWWLLVRVSTPAWVPVELEERDELALSLAERLDEDAMAAAEAAAEAWDLELPFV